MELSVSIESVCRIIQRAREYEALVPDSDPDEGSNATDDGQMDAIEDDGDNPAEEELRAMVDDLADDEQAEVIAAHGGRQRRLAAGGGRLPVGVDDEGRRGRAVRVERDVGATRAHAQCGFFVGRDYRVAAYDQIRACHAHARRANVVLMVGDQHMAPSCATLLRQAASVLRDDAFAFDMRCKTEQLPNGDDTRATHAVNDNAIGLWCR